MNIPLITKPETNDINASLIAIKREEERLNSLIDTANEKITELNELTLKWKDLVSVAESGNGNPITSNGVASAISNRTQMQIMPYYYSAEAFTWHKIGKISSGAGSQFPFVIFQIDMMGYYRNEQSARFVVQVGIYDRGTPSRRMSAFPVFRNSGSIVIAIDNELNVWVQIISNYGGGYVLTYIGDKYFTRDYAEGGHAPAGTVSGFTSIIQMTCRDAFVSQLF